VYERISEALSISGIEAVVAVFEKYRALIIGDVALQDRKAFLDDIEMLARTLH
jgi:hypothetical protein